MKRIFLIALLFSFAMGVDAQEKLVSHKVLGAKVAYEVSLPHDTITLKPGYSVTSYIIPVDTSAVINIDASKANPGNLLYFHCTGDSTQRLIRFRQDIEAVTDTVTNGTRLIGFVFIKDKFVQTIRTGEY